MEQYVIKGGNPLVGEVEIAGAKNAALAILAAAIMTDETILIENLPDVRDINVLLEAIAGIGAQVDRIDKSTVKINGSTIGDVSVDYEYIKKIRASYYLQHRKPSDRPASEGIQSAWCRCRYHAWSNCCESR